MSSKSKVEHLIINSPYKEPSKHWVYNAYDHAYKLVENGRRPASYVIADSDSDDSGFVHSKTIAISWVNKIRERVKAWREKGYPGTNGVTQSLLKHWQKERDPSDSTPRLYFCQIEAIETIIYFAEYFPEYFLAASESEKAEIALQGDGGAFRRLCTKLCTGGGKTTVMAMLIVWQICNRAVYKYDKRFSKNILVVTPGITVRDRLDALKIGGTENEYTHFDLVPPGYKKYFNQGKVIIRNWHQLVVKPGEEHSVVKIGPESMMAYAIRVLDGLESGAQNILVINDEAHHAWRINGNGSAGNTQADSFADSLREDKALFGEKAGGKNVDSKKAQSAKKSASQSRGDKEAEKIATVWIEGLDRIHSERKILTCYDFSATPFAPSGRKNDGESLFTWIISDFGLSDGIEAGLVKTPRAVIRARDVLSER